MEIKEKLRISLAQININWEDPQKNRDYLERLIKGLYKPTDLIIFPETFTTGFSMRAQELAEEMNGPTLTWMQNMAVNSSAAICGSLIIKESNRYYNRFVFVQPNGEMHYYNKRHLFTMGGEKDVFTAGDTKTIINYLGWRIALYVCYDLRFPVWCRNCKDTDLMVFTANWPMTRNFAWNTLLKARAIENQVYVAGINRIGGDGNGIKYIGETQVVDPLGKVVLNPTFQAGGLLSGEISMNDLQSFRKKFPVSDDADRFEILN
jgi:predicted amidohydrolase